MPRAVAQSSTAVASAPDCVTKARSPAFGVRCAKLALMPGGGRDEAEAVRPDDAQKMRLRRFEHRLLERLAFDALALAEAGGDDDGGAAAARAELRDERPARSAAAWR